MKILVVNGSPRGAKGNTAVLTKAFLEGAHAAGAESEIVYLKDKKIEHCIGCFACWLKTPGVCVHKDDMPELLEKMRASDITVYATPLYIYTVSGLMKDFMDRMIPIVQPFIEVQDGVCGHPIRYAEDGMRKVVLISNCGFPEQAHFSGLKETFRCCFRGSMREIAGMLCCSAGALLNVPGLRDSFAWYIDAMRRAGREVVERGFVSVETQATLDLPLMEDQRLFVEMANESFRAAMKATGALKETGEDAAAAVESAVGEPLTPPTSMETVRDLVAGMAMVFDARAAGDMRAVIQMIVNDEEPGRYFIEIAGGKCAAFAGEHPAPTATITTAANLWLAIARGEENGATAFMQGKYRVSGDIQLLMMMAKLFPTP